LSEINAIALKEAGIEDKGIFIRLNNLTNCFLSGVSKRNYYFVSYTDLTNTCRESIFIVDTINRGLT